MSVAVMKKLNHNGPSISFALRLKALVLDLLFIALISTLIMTALKQGFEYLFFHIPSVWRDELSGVHAQIYSASYLLTFVTYFLFSYYVGNGVTLGKMLLNLRVHSNHPSMRPLSFQESFLRTVGTLFCVKTGFFLFLIPMFNRQRKSLSDWLSQTTLLHIDSQHHSHTVNRSEEHDHQDEVTQGEVIQLSLFVKSEKPEHSEKKAA